MVVTAAHKEPVMKLFTSYRYTIVAPNNFAPNNFNPRDLPDGTSNTITIGR